MKSRTIAAFAAVCFSTLPACSGDDGDGKSNGVDGSGGGYMFPSSGGGPNGGSPSSGGAPNGGATSSGGAILPGGGSTGSGGDSRGGSTGSGGAGTGGSSGTEGSRVSFDGKRYEVALIARNVPPGDEQHVCVVVALPNTESIWVDQVDATLTGGSHHLIVDRQAPTIPVATEPTPCTPTMAGDDTRLVIAQQPETLVNLPEGAAFSLVPGQRIFLQLHYFNAGDQVRDIEGSVGLTLADTSAGAPKEAKSIFTGSLSISLPAGRTGTSTSFVIPRADSAGETRHVFALTSHTHKLGVRNTIERVPSAASPETAPIHESLSWEEPPLTFFTPVMDFNGSDGLRLVCRYENTTTRDVHFGTATTDEMCFMWIYYYDD
jgi:hypothetical protein